MTASRRCPNIAVTLDQPVGSRTMSDGKVMDAASTRERILDTALEVMARRGYTAAGVQEIVDLSGTSKGSFYFHFPSKEKMVIALLERMSEKLINKVYDSIKDQPSPLHRLSASIESMMNTFARKRNVAHVLLLNIVGNGKAMDKKFLPVREKFSRLIQSELDAAVAAGQVEEMDTVLVSRIWVGAFQEVILHWLLTGHPAPLTSAVPALRASLLRSIGADVSFIDTPGRKSGPGE